MYHNSTIDGSAAMERVQVWYPEKGALRRWVLNYVLIRGIQVNDSNLIPSYGGHPSLVLSPLDMCLYWIRNASAYWSSGMMLALFSCTSRLHDKEGLDSYSCSRICFLSSKSIVLRIRNSSSNFVHEWASLWQRTEENKRGNLSNSHKWCLHSGKLLFYLLSMDGRRVDGMVAWIYAANAYISSSKESGTHCSSVKCRFKKEIIEQEYRGAGLHSITACLYGQSEERIEIGGGTTWGLAERLRSEEKIPKGNLYPLKGIYWKKGGKVFLTNENGIGELFHSAECLAYYKERSAATLQRTCVDVTTLRECSLRLPQSIVEAQANLIKTLQGLLTSSNDIEKGSRSD
ncbi:hypothetical protein Tco_1576440 [Tanacetum coccineum]